MSQQPSWLQDVPPENGDTPADEQPPPPPGGGGFLERMASIETRLAFLATKTDVANAKVQFLIWSLGIATVVGAVFGVASGLVEALLTPDPPSPPPVP